MEILAVLIVGLLLVVFVLPIAAFLKARAAESRIGELQSRFAFLENELRLLRARISSEPRPEERVGPAPAAPAASAAAPPPESFAARRAAAFRAAAQAPEPPPLAPVQPEPAAAAVPPAEQRPPLRLSPPPIAPRPARPPVDWERFMGAKLFAWIGGLALFFGVAFFVKYSFEHDLIPAAARAAIGFLTGLALIGGGVFMRRKENAVTAQTLCATGVLILYGVTFACRAFYHFPFFTVAPTFALMSLITAAAFLLAVRMDAMTVAVLGIAGGFLTPVLLSTGEDHPLALFGYIALLDIGLLAVALRKQWRALPVLGAVGTVLMLAGWVDAFFVSGRYFAGGKTLIAMAVFAGFQALFLAAVAWARRTGKLTRALALSALGLGAAAMFSAFYFLSFESLGARPALLLSYLFLVDLGLLALSFLDEKLAPLEMPAGLAAFTFLAVWTDSYLTTARLPVALAFYFLFALFHSAAPLVRGRLRPQAARPWWTHGFPALALGLALMPILQLPELSILVWPFVLLVDALALALAVSTAALLPIAVVLLLTLLALGMWIFRIPGDLAGLPTALFLLGGFAVFFIVASAWACRRLAGAEGRAPRLFGDMNAPENLAVQLPAMSAALPFLLLIMATLRLPLADPSPVFGLALLLIALLLGMMRILSLGALPMVGLLSTLALEHAWHFAHFDAARATLPLLWYLGFYALFTAFPFCFHRRFEEKTAPWTAAALAGPLAFFLIHRLIRAAHPAWPPGLVPAAFAIPALLGFWLILRRTPAASAARDSQRALFGGAALYFLTLIFPIQFHREWITVGWALEGAALLWLFRRVPHPGLRLAGVALLVIVFARLALNPATLSYHPRAAMPIWNWFLYAYGIAAACCFLGARLLAPPRGRVLGFRAPPLLYTLCGILAFLLVNIEIADFFSAPGQRALTFQFSGNFARDMSYSMAWAAFALALLLIGIGKKVAPVRYASLALLGVTVLKLFLHDLSQLDQLYRIAAFIVVAVIAMLASFLYQRFLGAAASEKEPREPAPPAA